MSPSSIPGWRWVERMRTTEGVVVDDVRDGIPTRWRCPASWPVPSDVTEWPADAEPDLDDPVTGMLCLGLLLEGEGATANHRGETWWAIAMGPDGRWHRYDGPSLGRACLAVAADRGRWR